MKRLVVTLLTLCIALAASAQVSVTTSRNDNHRDGQNTSETILTPANVNTKNFGKLFSLTVDGYVYAQPLYMQNVTINGAAHNVVFIATEHDSVYAFDADSNTGANANPLWQVSFINPPKVNTVSSGNVSCGDLVPEIGVTSTPVIDPVAGTIYVLAKTREGTNAVQRLHALDITTGAERANSPVEITARVKGTGDGSSGGYIVFDPLRQAQRPGLLLQNGQVLIGWASHCDNGPYHGWLMSYDQTALTQTSVWNVNPNGSDSGIWQAGNGLAADTSFNIFVATGNGTFDANPDFGDSIVKLATASGKIRPADYFTPYNQQQLSDDDADLGSGGVLLLPDQTQGPNAHLLIEVGKEGSVYLVNRDNMGHYNPNNNNQIVQDMENVMGGNWSTAAFWNNNVYFGPSYDSLKQYTFNPTTGLLSTSPASQSNYSFQFPGPSPSISANGTTNGIVWIIQSDNYGHGPGTLHAVDATNLANELYNSGQNFKRDNPGGAIKFTVPTIANGKVYVGAVKQVSVYGLLGNK